MKNYNKNNPPGYPGISPTWAASSKSGVGTSNTSSSRLWFTIAKGIVTEVFFPRIDQINVKDLQFLISNGKDLFEDEKKDCNHEIIQITQGVPAFKVINTSKKNHYRIEKVILSDPRRPVLLQKINFELLEENDFHLYVLLNPHIKNYGLGNNGWIGDYKGIKMLFAEREDVTLALACSTSFLNMSCGYVGFSDGWQDIKQNKKMTMFYLRASDGNVALIGEIIIPKSKKSIVLALAFGTNAAEAGQLARTTLFKDFDQLTEEYEKTWLEFQEKCLKLDHISDNTEVNFYRISTAVLRTHMDKRFSDGSIASLSIPWGYTRSDNDLGGYHIVWPRDLVETAGGLLAAGDITSAKQLFIYLMSTQEEDGHWPQNMWLDGTIYWKGIQMDETAFPILLANALNMTGQLKGIEFWTTIKKAASYLVCNGPVSQEDRWEEDPGYSPFTLAVEIAALLVAAEFAENFGEKEIAKYLTEIADAWNSNIERWTYVTHSNLTQRLKIDGYYVRISPPDVADAASPADGYVPIKNRPPSQSRAQFEYIVSPDALALVRFGLRSANDPKIINTVKVIDALLKTNTKNGPVWHRYNQDGYGEHENGDPFDGVGIGRGWPLLAGERAHYEIAKGDTEQAKKLLKVIESQAGPGGLIPEQVWDSEDIEEKDLFNGFPSGSAMPLVWAHAEYIKLLRSLNDKKIFDMPNQTFQRYIINKVSSNLTLWRYNHKSRKMKVNNILRVELPSPAIVHWSTNSWKTAQDSQTKDSGLGLYYVDLPTAQFKTGTQLVFTFHWSQNDQWEGKDYYIQIE